MGIQGLLPFLKEIQRDIHVSSFRGRRVAVDAYCWLHRGAYACALQLVMKTEKLETLPFIKYCMKRVNMLLNYDITPVMVFDGGYLPIKANTEKERRERRQVNRERGKALLKEGRKSEAVDCFQKSVDVSPEMALALIKECRRAGVECIVAPYEADSQLAYLNKEGIVDVVITEDSDLLVFGCKKVIFKLDDSGNGKLIESDQLGKANRGLVGFTVDSFRHMCILSGCDYLASVHGIGLGKALKLMKRFNKDPYRAIKALHYENGKVPKDYEDNFRKADQTFLYQMVFDPRTQQQVRLSQLPNNVEMTDYEFAGVQSSPRKAVGMARGNINPLNHAIMDTYSPSKTKPPPTAAKSRSLSGSVMAGNGRWNHTTTSLPPPPFSSESRRNHFKPPKRSRPKPAIEEEDVDSVKDDEDLQTMYLNASMATATNNIQPIATSPIKSPDKTHKAGTVAAKKSPIKLVKKSRFFSSSSDRGVTTSDETPTAADDIDVAEKLRARRRLAIMPPSIGPPSPSPSLNIHTTSDENTAVERDSPMSDEEMLAKRYERRRKRLSSCDTHHSITAQLEGFAYTKSTAKKAKHTSDQLTEKTPATDGGHPITPPAKLKNPFAKSLQNAIKTDFSQDICIIGEAGATSMNGSSSLNDFDKEVPTQLRAEATESDHNAMITSEVDVTDTACVSTDCVSTEPATRRSFMTSADYIVTTRPQPSLMNHVAPPNTSVVSSNSGRRRQVGTRAKSRSIVNSKFKPPKRKLHSEPGLVQLNLRSQFGYCSRPQMSSEQ